MKKNLRFPITPPPPVLNPKGIGQFTAEQLARKKHVVLVHGRNPERVEQTVNRLQKISGTEVHGYLEHEGLLGIGPETFKVGKGLSEKKKIFNGCIV